MNTIARILLLAAVGVTILAGCGSSSGEAPAATNQTKADIKNNSSISDAQKQATLTGLSNAEINRQIHLTGKLPNGQTVPVIPPKTTN